MQGSPWKREAEQLDRRLQFFNAKGKAKDKWTGDFQDQPLLSLSLSLNVLITPINCFNNWLKFKHKLD